jgi:hypothetical protein
MLAVELGRMAASDGGGEGASGADAAEELTSGWTKNEHAAVEAAGTYDMLINTKGADS